MFHIFILDDNAADSALLLLAFKRARHDASVYTVSDSRLLPAYLDIKSPVETLRTGRHPNILVLPTQMSFYSGFETLAWVREQERFDKMFIVMLAPQDDATEREHAISAGVNLFRVQTHPAKNFVQLAESILQEYAAWESKGMKAPSTSLAEFAIFT